jgi:hypothetical protein
VPPLLAWLVSTLDSGARMRRVLDALDATVGATGGAGEAPGAVGVVGASGAAAATAASVLTERPDDDEVSDAAATRAAVHGQSR